MSDKVQPIHEIFLPRAQGLIHLLRQHVRGFQGATSRESVRSEQFSSGGTLSLRFWRRDTYRDHGKTRQPYILFGNITPLSPEGVSFGPETTLKSEFIGSNEETADNRGGDSDLEIAFSDVASKESGKETTKDKSAGGSVKTTVTEEAGVEGVEKFSGSIEAEAHFELSESETRSESSGSEQGGDEGTVVKPGSCKNITETRWRRDTRQTVTANGAFSFFLQCGIYTHNNAPRDKWEYTEWESWQQFLDCINGDAPDNYPLADAFKRQPIYNADRWALADLSAKLRYDVTFEGKVIREFRVANCK